MNDNFTSKSKKIIESFDPPKISENSLQIPISPSPEPPLQPRPLRLQSLSHVLPELFETLNQSYDFDETDWIFAIRFAERWKLSVADALIDLNFLDETSLAKALAAANNLAYQAGVDLKADFSEVSFDDYDDLSSVGAVPLVENRLAICNPYDDLRGYLGNRICGREFVVTERSELYKALRNQCLERWLDVPDDEAAPE